MPDHRDPDYLEESVRRLVKAARRAMTSIPSTSWGARDELTAAIAYARPYAEEVAQLGTTGGQDA